MRQQVKNSLGLGILAGSALLCIPAWSQPTEIAVYLDGRRVSTQSQVVGASLPPIVLSDQVLVPIRLINEELRREIWFNPSWGILQLDERLMLKVGEKQAHCARPMVGGAVTEQIPLPLAPRVMGGRLYVPVERTLFRRMGYAVEWDRKQRVLRFQSQSRRD
jgi:hypothetical protein